MIIIYFIQQGKDGPVKIGHTNGIVNQRLSQLQIGNPQKLYLLNTILGDARDEAEIHSMFSDIHIRGEWFYPTQKLLSMIRKQETRRYDIEELRRATERAFG